MTGFFGPWDLGRLLGDTFGIYRKRWPFLIAMVAPFILIIELISWRLNLTVTDWTSLPDLDYSSSAAFTVLFVVLGYTLLDILIATVIETMMNCPFIHTIGQQYTRNRISISEAIISATKRVLTVMMAILLRLVVIAALAITIVGIPLAAYIYVKWLFVTHIILFEGKGVPEALSKSSDLVKGNWWRISGYLIVVTVIVIAVIVVSVSIDMLLPQVTSFNIMATAASIIYTPITIIATTLIYFTLRVEKEGYHTGRLGADMQAWDADRRPYYAPDPIVRLSYCLRCGQQLAPQTKFCPNCGKQVSDNSSSTEAQDEEGHTDDGPFLE